MIAKDGFGYVYKVKDIKNGQYVAVKQMPMHLFDADYKIKALNL
jgi:serine/threonine protein kinase